MRQILGLAGPPGAGKTTYALAWAAELGAAYLPMDGFHLADAALDALGLRDAKGAPATFDAHGYAALLRRLRERPDHTVWAPSFARDLEQPLAGAIGIGPEVEVVVTEGNYLLLQRPEWRAVRAELDECAYLDVDDAVRRERLVARHVAFGKTPAEARAWVERVDEPNARLVAASRSRADRVVSARDEPATGPGATT